MASGNELSQSGSIPSVERKPFKHNNHNHKSLFT